MYNFHFVVQPKEKLEFINQKAQIQIKNITKYHLGFKIRTTNITDFKVIGNKGILNPQTNNIVQILSHSEIISKAKFQIQTVIINPNDDIDSAFQRANSEQIQITTLKTKSTFDDNTKSTISGASFIQSTIMPKFPQLESNNNMINNNNIKTPPNEVIKINEFQPNIVHMLLIGVICLLIGYFTHFFQTYDKMCK